MRISLTEAEIDALLTAAGAADPTGTFEHLDDDKAEERAAEALERAMDKLRSAFGTLNARKIVARNPKCGEG
jgi:hypothetical protein